MGLCNLMQIQLLCTVNYVHCIWTCKKTNTSVSNRKPSGACETLSFCSCTGFWQTNERIFKQIRQRPTLGCLCRDIPALSVTHKAIERIWVNFTGNVLSIHCHWMLLATALPPKEIESTACTTVDHWPTWCYGKPDKRIETQQPLAFATAN